MCEIRYLTSGFLSCCVDVFNRKTLVKLLIDSNQQLVKLLIIYKIDTKLQTGLLLANVKLHLMNQTALIKRHFSCAFKNKEAIYGQN